MSRFATLLRQHIAGMPTYTPIEPFEVLSHRLGRTPQELIKLDANENPYGASPAVRRALAELEFAHIYPDPESRLLREGLSAFTGIPQENLMAGAGADELIDLLLRLFVEPGDRVLVCPPTFGMYAFDTRLNAGQVVSTPRRSDFSLDLPAIQQAVADRQPKLLFLATPNNPDGSLPSREEIDALLELPLVVVLDEAYIEFSGAGALGERATRLPEVPRRENLVVLRTFSKLAGLAGLRVGYGGFPDWLMPALWKAKQPYNVNVAASQAALSALQDRLYLEDSLQRLRLERDRLYEMLSGFEWLHPYPSRANFVLARVTGRNAAELKNRLALEHGILVRHFSTPGLDDHIRVSAGRPQDTQALRNALRGME
jgi:histidinol-phosphate aminotransferase